MELKHHSGSRGEFYLEDDGHKVGELTYNLISAHHMIIDSTYISPSYRENGKAHDLLDAAVEFARKNDIKIETSCSFVRRTFRESNLYDDVKIF